MQVASYGMSVNLQFAELERHNIKHDDVAIVGKGRQMLL
jgi:hypothetical protein